MQEPTPAGLVVAITNINNLPVECVDGNFTLWFTELCKLHRCLYSAFYSGNSRKVHKFCCTFGGRISSEKGAKTNFNCSSYVKFRIYNGIVSFMEADFTHTHKTTERTYLAHRSVFTIEEKEEIVYLRSIGAPSGLIRRQLTLPVLPQSLYDTQRKFIKEMKRDEIPLLKSGLKKFKNFEKIYTYNTSDHDDPGRRIVSVTLINKELVDRDYSKDICVIDDTAKTNMYGLNGEVMVVIDPEGGSQILAFSLLPDLTIDGFKSFFQEVRNFTHHSFRLMIMDRSRAQFTAVREVFPESNVIFCRIHVLRNIETRFGVNSNIYKAFEEMMHDESKEEVFFEYMEQNYDEDSTEMLYINNVMEDKEYFLLSYTKHYYPFSNITSNRAENIFKELKVVLCHNTASMFSILSTIIKISNKYLVHQLRIMNENNRISESELISQSEFNKIGKFAMDRIEHQFNLLKTNNFSDDPCIYCSLLFDNREIYIPCVHYLRDRLSDNESQEPLISASDIGKRWHRPNTSEPEEVFIENPVEHENTYQMNDEFNYTNYMSIFSHYVSLANNNETLRTMLVDNVRSLREVVVEGSPEEPITVSQRGQQTMYPARNVSRGRQRTTTVYRCSLCHLPGHTRPRCPNNNSILSLVYISIKYNKNINYIEISIIEIKHDLK